jgi:nitrogen fixation protein FixH
MKKPLNPWPVGIFAAFGLFVAGTVALVVTASSNRMDLVSPDYYEQELRYQKKLDGLNRTQQLPAGVKVSFDATRKSITLTLPAEHARQLARGEITFFRPSAAGLDRRVELQLSPDGTQSLDASALQPGLWKIRVQWQVAGEEFFLDETLVVKATAS